MDGRAVVLAAIVIGGVACRPKPPDAIDYLGKVAAARASKDLTLKNTSSPLPESRKVKFLPLAYYPVDPA